MAKDVVATDPVIPCSQFILHKMDWEDSMPISPSACNGCFRARQTTHWIGNDKNRVLGPRTGVALDPERNDHKATPPPLLF
ncbi:hypothetical protein CEXT_280161 [Caerostris extrusa]|uniref:Uncharacterized protein n=1 Tax=Caerostris extrusa TaxID=172846 RepID=A0AAV4XQ68_CAEEX|nr:hypothetical protein CEXT_280161 [Caerostris extrusa]